MPKSKPPKKDHHSESALLHYAFRLLARQDYSEAEMVKKLRQKLGQIFGKADMEMIGNVLARLKELGYLNDEKFARQYLESRLAVTPQGKYLLRSKLRHKGISSKIFEKLWGEGKYDEEMLAQRILQQKKRLFVGFSGTKRKQKVMQFLASRGFSGEVIFDLIERE